MRESMCGVARTFYFIYALVAFILFYCQLIVLFLNKYLLSEMGFLLYLLLLVSNSLIQFQQCSSLVAIPLSMAQGLMGVLEITWQQHTSTFRTFFLILVPHSGNNVSLSSKQGNKWGVAAPAYCYIENEMRRSPLINTYTELVQQHFLFALYVMCVCSNANPLHYYALWVPCKVDRWHQMWSIFESCTTWADHITCGTSICIVYQRKLRLE